MFIETPRRQTGFAARLRRDTILIQTFQEILK
jgi:hypothetical protein